MNTLVYVDAENVSFADFKDYLDLNLAGKMLHGKVYGNNEILGDSVSDYLKLGFDYIDTSKLSSSSKNVADMKILTDCAFDVLQTYNGTNVDVALITKDCDFLPLVYRLNSMKIPVTVPMIGKDEVMTVPQSTVTKALEAANYKPMESDAWMVQQTDYAYNLLNGSIDYNMIDRYFNRKRVRFIHAIAEDNPELAMKLDIISKANFSARSIFKELRKNRCSNDCILSCLSIYTNKYFGKAFKPSELKKFFLKLS